MQDGLPSNTVYYVYQDSKKFIWFATDAGVSRYDGSTFTNYRKKDGLANNEIIRIKEDSSGRVWFFHFNGSLSFMWRNKIYSENNTSFLKSLEGKEFYFDFVQDNNSTIYFYNRICEILTLDKLNRTRKYNLQDKLLRSIPHGHKINSVLFLLRQITKSNTGEFFCWTRNGLFKLKTISGQPIFISQDHNMYAVYPGGGNMVLVNTYSNKIYKFRNEHLIDSITLPIYSDGTLSSVLGDKSGFLWIADHTGIKCSVRK